MISVENRMWDSLRKFWTKIGYLNWSCVFFCRVLFAAQAPACQQMCTLHRAQYCIDGTCWMFIRFRQNRQIIHIYKINALTRPNCDSKVYRFKLSYWKLWKHARGGSSASRFPIKNGIDALRPLAISIDIPFDFCSIGFTAYILNAAI